MILTVLLLLLVSPALPQSTVNELYDQGQKAMKENRHRDAADLFERALAIAPPGNTALLAGLHYYHGAALGLSGDYLVAIASLKQAIHYAPGERTYRDFLTKVEQQAAGSVIPAEQISRALRASRSFAAESGPASIDLWVNYEFDRDVLSKSGLEQAAELAKVLQSAAFADSRFKLIGHTDSRGTDEYNKELSSRRAARLRDYLAQGGMDSKRLDVEGHGEMELKAQGETEEIHAINRRVEVQLLPMK
jgi:outer membrane protein OmpA-like peptidoglycan-associated protein